LINRKKLDPRKIQLFFDVTAKTLSSFCCLNVKKINIMATSILSINPKLYSTEIAVSKNDDIFYHYEIEHSNDDLILFENLVEQIPFRRDAIMNQLRKDNINIKELNYVVAEGGLLRPCQSGVYAIDKNMVGDLLDGIAGDDIINLGGLLAFTVANSLRIKSLVVEPASVDERSELASFTTHPSLRKKSLFHALIHKYLSRKYASDVKKNYEDLNIIFCHVNERSVSVAAHKKGKVVDVNQAYMGFGPMGFCEIGTLPVSAINDMLFKKCYSKDEMLKLVKTNGTSFSYLGTNSINEIIKLFENNDKKTKQMLEAMAYQISKEIVSHYVSLDAQIDAIILSGEIFSAKRFFKYISKRIEKLAPIVTYPKDYTFEAMVFNVLQVENKKEEIKTYV